MRKIFIGVCAALLLTGCNRQIIDLTYNFNKAIITLGDGTKIDGEVESWRDFDDGDMIQVTINGKTYLTHSSNVLLIHE